MGKSHVHSGREQCNAASLAREVPPLFLPFPPSRRNERIVTHLPTHSSCPDLSRGKVSPAVLWDKHDEDQKRTPCVHTLALLSRHRRRPRLLEPERDDVSSRGRVTFRRLAPGRIPIVPITPSNLSIETFARDNAPETPWLFLTRPLRARGLRR